MDPTSTCSLGIQARRLDRKIAQMVIELSPSVVPRPNLVWKFRRELRLPRRTLQLVPFARRSSPCYQTGDPVQFAASSLVVAECPSVQKRKAHIPRAVQQSFIRLLKSGSAVMHMPLSRRLHPNGLEISAVEGIACGGEDDQLHAWTSPRRVHNNQWKTRSTADTQLLFLQAVGPARLPVLPPRYSSAAIRQR